MAGVLLKILSVFLCFQIVLCQFGFFPTREARRYPSPFGFSQNFFPNPSSITNTINKILQENPFSNSAYIFPFQNRPITTPNQNPYPNNVRFPGQGHFPNLDQPNSSGYPGNSANVPPNTGFYNNNSGFTGDPTFTDNNNAEGTLTSGQQTGPVFGSDASHIGNGGTDSLQSGQQPGPTFGEGEHYGSSGNLAPGQQNNPVFNTNFPNFENRGPDTVVPGLQNGPVAGQDLVNNNNGGSSTLVSGQNNGPTFSTDTPNLGNSGTNTLVSGQQTGPVFGSNLPNGESTLVSGEHNSNAFSTEAPNLGNSGTNTLVSGQQTGPVFGSNLPNDESTLVSGEHNGNAFSTEAPNLGNSGTNTLVSGQQTGPVFGSNLPNGESTLVSGEHNGNAFSTEAPNLGNSGTNTLVSGQQTGPVFGSNLPNGESTLVSGEHNGNAFSTETPNLGNSGTNTLVSGQQTGPVFGSNLPTGESTLVSGEHNGNAFSTEAPNLGNSGTNTLVSGQQTGPVFGSNLPNGESTLVSGEHSGNAFSTEAPYINGGAGSLISGEQTGPTFGNGFPSSNDGSSLVSGQNIGPAFNFEPPKFENTGTLVSGEQNGPVFDPDLPQNIGGTGDLFSGQNGLVFGMDSPNNNGVLISGKHSGPVYSPDAPLPTFESRNDFNQGIFRETCTTVEGGIGSCVSITTCEPFVVLLQQAKTNPDAVRKLRAAHCGFEGNNPKVCCPLPAPPTPPPVVIPSGKSIPTSDFITAFPEPPECGVSNASFSRVVGGVNAHLGDFPWMALLGYQGRRGASTRWLCGGSLVSHHHVLTAAHCIHNHEDDLYVVRLGELDLARDDEGATPTDVLIKYKIKHEKYNSTAFTNDIGLLVLDRDVEFTDLIRPICIPTRPDLRSNNFVDYNPLIAGWGDTEFRGPSASHLQVLQLPVLDNSYCSKAYARYSAQVIDERVMCAGFKKGGKDACQGDSGGPLMQPDYNPEKFTTYFYQTGVVSFGRKCAEAGFPGIYTRVTYFVPWLQKNMLGLAE